MAAVESEMISGPYIAHLVSHLEQAASAAEALLVKGKARERLASVANGADVLFVGEAYDVTVTSASCAKLVVEDLLDDLARTYGIRPEVMASLKRRHTTTVTTTRVCAKARIERAAA